MKITPPKTLIERFIESVGSVPSLAVHSVLFIAVFSLSIFGLVDWQIMLLGLTTVISIEAIYLALFIQIAVNRNTAQLREVEEDIDEIQEDVEELGEDMDEIQEDIEEISEDIDEIQEDVEELSEEDDDGLPREPREPKEKKPRAEKPKKSDTELLEDLTKDINRLLRDLEELKKKK